MIDICIFNFQVDTYVCRDLDSRFSQREFDAVREWLKSDQVIHSMRDHYGHLIPMLGITGLQLS